MDAPKHTLQKVAAIIGLVVALLAWSGVTPFDNISPELLSFIAPMLLAVSGFWLTWLSWKEWKRTQ
jgi:hypothetical protein